MDVKLYLPGFSRAVSQALIDGLKEVGDNGYIEFNLKRREPDCDLVAFYGFRPPQQELSYLYQSAEIPSLVLGEARIRIDGYYAVGINGLHWLPDSDMPGDRFKKLGIDRATEPNNHQGDNILLLGQMPGDAQHPFNPSGMLEWVYRTAGLISKNTDRELVYRPHPNLWSVYRQSQLLHPVGIDEVVQSDKVSLRDDLAAAFAAVTYNSTAANQALLAGVPVFCDPCASYADIANTNIKDLDDPEFHDTEEYFNNLAYTQWTIDEMANGEMWTYFKQEVLCVQ